MSQTKNINDKSSLQDSHPEPALEADRCGLDNFSLGPDESMQSKCKIDIKGLPEFQK
jgi:hypothetical protein